VEKYTLTITEDEAIVLFEYFNRYGDTRNLAFDHPAEYIALQRVAGQIDKTTAAPFRPEYSRLLENARNRIAAGFEGDVPGMKLDM
jgi:hypothetical protein